MSPPLRPLAALLLTLTACDKPKDGPAPSPSATASASASAATSAPASASASATASAKPPAAEPTAVAAQHVLVAYAGAKDAPKGVKRTKAEAKARAEEVASKAKSGGDFTELVKSYSDDPAAKERMGSVGKFTRDKMVKPFSDAAFALEVDATSGVVETPFGFHVIKRNQ